MYFVFRKSDGVILYQSYTSEQAENEWQSCLKSEGGVKEDYIRTAGRRRDGGSSIDIQRSALGNVPCGCGCGQVPSNR